MKLVGLMPCRNEAWVLGLSARVALEWCDLLIVADHWSTDQSRDILNSLHDEHGSGRILIRDDREHEWREMEQRQMLLEEAREHKATHIALIDADEALTGNLVSTIRDQINIMPRGHILQLPGYNLRNGLNQYHANGIWGNRWFSVAFQDEPRLHWGGDQFHHREPMGGKLTVYRPVPQGQGGVLHLWGASERRLKAKHALFKVTERLRWPQKSVEDIDQMYSWAIHGDSRNRGYGTPNTWDYAKVPPEWWKQHQGLLKHLDVDAMPWQEQAVREAIQEYGPEPFSRLDLFGVA